MTDIRKASPTPTPLQAQLFPPGTDSLPKPLRHVIALVADEIEVECAALKMQALECAGRARAVQLALFGLGAATSAMDDPRWVAEFAKCRDHLDRERTRLRDQAIKLSQRWVPHSEDCEGDVPPWN